MVLLTGQTARGFARRTQFGVEPLAVLILVPEADYVRIDPELPLVMGDMSFVNSWVELKVR